MKIRNGFVSNSSSSSYVLYIPDNFDREKFFQENEQIAIDIIENDEKYDQKKFKKIYLDFLNGGGFWRDNDYISYEALYEMFSDFEVASMETGPDEGQMVILDNQKIKKIDGLKIKKFKEL